MRVFLASPITHHLDPATLRFDPRLKRLLLSVKGHLEAEGHDVFLAIAEEGWGQCLLGPIESVERDYQEMAARQAVVCLPGNPPSGGCHIELGWASALRKPIVLLLDPHAVYSPLVLGLQHLTDVYSVYVCLRTTPQELARAMAQVHRFLAMRPLVEVNRTAPPGGGKTLSSSMRSLLRVISSTKCM